MTDTASADLPAVVSETFDPARWRVVEGFEDLTDVTYHRQVERDQTGRVIRDLPCVRIAFDRPEVRNAFRPRTVDELYHVLDHARMSGDVGAVILADLVSVPSQRLQQLKAVLGDDRVTRSAGLCEAQVFVGGVDEAGAGLRVQGREAAVVEPRGFVAELDDRLMQRFGYHRKPLPEDGALRGAKELALNQARILNRPNRVDRDCGHWESAGQVQARAGDLKKLKNPV